MATDRSVVRCTISSQSRGLAVDQQREYTCFHIGSPVAVRLGKYSAKSHSAFVYGYSGAPRCMPVGTATSKSGVRRTPCIHVGLYGSPLYMYTLAEQPAWVFPRVIGVLLEYFHESLDRE